MIHLLTDTYTVVDPTFGRSPAPIELDMGCGKGRFVLALAARYPERIVLGSDVMLGRLRRVARKAERRRIENLDLLRANNLALAGYAIPPASISRIHLLCPDPWPKNRHRPKRLVNTDFLCRLTRILVPGGILHLATDHAPYLEDWIRMLRDLPVFESAPESIEDIRDLKTDFEIRWETQGKQVPHLAYRFRP